LAAQKRALTLELTKTDHIYHENMRKTSYTRRLKISSKTADPAGPILQRKKNSFINSWICIVIRISKSRPHCP